MRTHVFQRRIDSSFPAGRMASAFSYQSMASRNDSYAIAPEPGIGWRRCAFARRSQMMPA